MTTKKKSTRTNAAEEARRNAWAAGADACAPVEGATSATSQVAQPVRICNASMFAGDYRTGYGEVHQPLRAGAMQALQVHSRGIGT